MKIIKFRFLTHTKQNNQKPEKMCGFYTYINTPPNTLSRKTSKYYKNIQTKKIQFLINNFIVFINII